MQVCSRLSTGAPWYLRGINHRIIAHYNLSCVLLASLLFLKRTHHHESGYKDTVNKSFTEFYELAIKFHRKNCFTKWLIIILPRFVKCCINILQRKWCRNMLAKLISLPPVYRQCLHICMRIIFLCSRLVEK